MLKLLISAQQWDKMDQWSDYTLPGIFIVGGLIVLFIGIIPFVYSKNKVTKWMFIVSAILAVGFGSFAYIKNQGLKDYYAENKYITPQSRSYEAQMFYKKPYDVSDVEAWKYEDDWEGLSKLTSIYKRKPVKERVTYLGRNDSYVYVKINNQIIRFYESDCKKINGNLSYLTGYRFVMRDKEFKKLGFLKLPYYFEKEVLISKKEWDKQATIEVVKNYDTPGLAGNWITDARR